MEWVLGLRYPLSTIHLAFGNWRWNFYDALIFGVADNRISCSVVLVYFYATFVWWMDLYLYVFAFEWHRFFSLLFLIRFIHNELSKILDYNSNRVYKKKMKINNVNTAIPNKRNIGTKNCGTCGLHIQFNQSSSFVIKENEWIFFQFLFNRFRWTIDCQSSVDFQLSHLEQWTSLQLNKNLLLTLESQYTLSLMLY